MVNFKISGNSIELSCSKNIKIPLLICSHERSGTHFMMNSISKCTHYTASPYINFDYMPLGSFVNFFSEKSINNLFKVLTNISSSNSINYCSNSIIKSHFPLTLQVKVMEIFVKLFISIEILMKFLYLIGGFYINGIGLKDQSQTHLLNL